jgi:hypothetical protein
VFNDLRFQVNDRAEVALVFDLGVQKRPSTVVPVKKGPDIGYATARLARYSVTPQIRVGGRVEYFGDKEEVAVVTPGASGFETFGASINLDIAPTSNFLWRLEGRLFNARSPVFPSHNGLDRSSGFIATSFALRWSS